MTWEVYEANYLIYSFWMGRALVNSPEMQTKSEKRRSNNLGKPINKKAPNSSSLLLPGSNNLDGSGFLRDGWSGWAGLGVCSFFLSRAVSFHSGKLLPLRREGGRAASERGEPSAGSQSPYYFSLLTCFRCLEGLNLDKGGGGREE